MRFYYDIFGGSLRNLRFVDRMNENDPYPGSIYDIVQAEMTSFFAGPELIGISEATWNRTAKALAKELHYGWLDVPATRFMRHLAGHICDTSNKDALSRLKEEIDPSDMGFVHEHDAHQYRLTHLGKAPGITLWSLQDETKETLCLPIKRVVRIRSVSDIELLQEGDYGLPTVSNFPFADAVINGYLFQDTIAQSHPSVPKILESLKKTKTTGRDKPTLVNTLSTDNFDKFKMNKGDEMKPFSQWKTRMESHVDDIAIATAHPPMEESERSASRKRKQNALTGEKKTKKIKKGPVAETKLKEKHAKK